MNAVFHLDASELDEFFVKGLKQTFHDRRLVIEVREMDETEYLLGSEANKRALLSAANEVKAGRNIIGPAN